MLITVARIDVFRGTAARVLVPTDRGCPCCGGAVLECELEWEVSGLPIHVEQACSTCTWLQGWDPTHQWVRTPDFPPPPAEVVCIAG